MAVGILVHGDNHFIVRGPEPEMTAAVDMVRRWSIIQIGKAPEDHERISRREFRENLEWAIVVPGEREMSAAVVELLNELAARGVAVRRGE